MDKKTLKRINGKIMEYGKLDLITKLGISIRKNIHPILLSAIPSRRKEELSVDGVIPSDDNYLIVANHSCISDIPALAEAVKEHFYVLVSDEDRNTLDGIGLDFNGVYWVNRLDKESRICSSEAIGTYLDNGVSFAMYPEATWNLSPNYLMLPMNYGYVKIACQTKTNKAIIPVVTFFSDNKRYSVISEAIQPTDDLIATNNKVRDIMGTMLYNEIQRYYNENADKPNVHKMMIDGEIYYYEKRDELDPYYWENYVSKLYDAYPRAKKNPEGVREYESQFIIEPKNDAYEFFIIFNSSIRFDKNGNILIKRITSEKNGYQGTTSDDIDYDKFFGYSYNEINYKKKLLKK